MLQTRNSEASAAKFYARRYVIYEYPIPTPPVSLYSGNLFSIRCPHRKVTHARPQLTPICFLDWN